MADLQTAMIARFLGHAGISGAVGNDIHWNTAAQSAVLPYIVMRVVSDPRPRTMRGYQASRAPRIAVEVFSASYEEARSVSESIIALMSVPETIAGVRFGKGAAQGPRDLGEDTPSGFIHRLRTDLFPEHSIQ